MIKKLTLFVFTVRVVKTSKRQEGLSMAQSGIGDKDSFQKTPITSRIFLHKLHFD